MEGEYFVAPRQEDWACAADYNGDGHMDFGRMLFRNEQDPLFGVFYKIP